MDPEEMQQEDDGEVDVQYIDDSFEIEGDDESGEISDSEEQREDEEEMEGNTGPQIQPDRDDAKAVFSDHREPVLTVRFDGSGKFIATGGQDDVSYCWDVLSTKQLVSSVGHNDSVNAVAFNIDSTLFASADMNGLVQVWNTATQRRVMKVTLGEIEWIAFHNREARALLCGHADGTVTMWQIPKSESNQNQDAVGPSNEDEPLPRNKTLYASSSSCLRGALFADGRRLATAHDDGSVRIWNLATTSQLKSWERRDVISNSSAKQAGSHDIAETEEDDLTPTCIDIHRDDVVFAVGRVDGRVLLFHSQTGRLLTSFDSIVRDSSSLAATSQQLTQAKASSKDEESDEQSAESCESAVFINALELLATGALEGTVTLFDLGSSRVRSRWRQPDGAQMSKLISFGDSPHIVATAGLDAIVRLYDVRNQQIVRTCSGHSAQILDADYSATTRLLVTASDDHTARVFEPFSS